MVVANATGCSSIYGGNLPTTPWTSNADGRGPGVEQLVVRGQRRVRSRAAPRPGGRRRRSPASCSNSSPTRSGRDLVELDPGRRPAGRGRHPRPTRTGRRPARRARPLVANDDGADGAAARHLLALADSLTRKGVWIIGGDGWAYDIGFGGLDHVLSSGRNVNILVLDTEVYSNTGGQASKATSRGAVAKFAAAGKSSAKKDLGAIARAYGNVYVAEIAIGANDLQTTKALLEADAWPGPSLVIAYSTCIAHGIDMSHVDEPPEGRRPFRLLAAVPLPAERGRARHPVQARLQGAVDAGRRVPRHRGPLRGAGPHPPRQGGAPAPAGPGGRRRALALLQPARDDRAHRRLGVAGPRPRSRCRQRRARRSERCPVSTPPTSGWRCVRRSSPRPARSPATRTPQPASPTPAPAALVLPSLFEEEIVHEQVELIVGTGRGQRALRRGARLLPGDPGVPRHDRPLPRQPRTHEGSSAGAGDRQPQRLVARRLGPLRPPAWRRRRRRHRAERLPGRGRPGVAAPTRSKATTSRSSPTSRLPSTSRSPSSCRRSTRRWPTSPCTPSKPVPTGSCCSTASTNPISTSTRSTSSPRLELSSAWELRLPLRWIAILRPILSGRASLAATSGVETGADVAKALLVGADVAMTTSAVLRHGPDHVRVDRG